MSFNITPRQLTAFLITVLVLVAVAAVRPRSATATPYWTTLTGGNEIANGINGFSTLTAGGSWSTYGNTCETKVSSYSAGAYCKFRFTAPSGTTALEGIARGQYAIANTSMVLRSERPGGNPSYVLDVASKGAFGHGFGALGPYFDLGFFTKAATSLSGAYNWMHIDTFEVRLDDPSVPVSLGVSFPGASASGWYGPGCVAGNYGWSDAGSQLWSTSLTNLTTGQGVHGWTAAPGRRVVVSGVPSVAFPTCIPSSGTGTQTYRSAASDRAGNGASQDFSLKFDATPPVIGGPEFADAPLENGHVFGAASNYRPAISWPGVSDAHSGVASIDAWVNGAAVPVSSSGTTVTLTPSASLPLGNVAITLRVRDQVGNENTSTRTVVVADDAAPTITVASPAATGGASPVLDVSAVDDYAGLGTTSWTVLVDGQVLVAASSNQRLQADIGLLADGNHTIQISIADHAGNIVTKTIAYAADSGPGVPQLPDGFTTGIFVYEAASTSLPAETHRFRALMVKHGRPVAGRAEIREDSDTVASKELETNGTVDMAITINKLRTQLTYNGPSGVGLDPVTMLVACDLCASGGAGDPGKTGVPVGAAGRSGEISSGGARFPANVIYYVGNVPMWNGIPLAESGADLDKVAPSWKVTLLQQKRGVVRRTGQVTLRLWTSELAVVQVMPIGSVNRMTVSARRVTRTIRISITPKSALARRLRTARAGQVLAIRVRVVAADRNGNRSVPKTFSLKVRV
ncbi:MAG: hypothetical protein H7287_14555 [Thermoleophilia bacterium]|nr:hypothetical protein [Thermoleophilia bacterium]